MSSILGVGAGVITISLAIWAGYTALYEGNLATPDYSVVRKDHAFEIREYKPFTVAMTSVSEQSKGGLSTGFRRLAGYIFGGNSEGTSLAMTAPVLQQNFEAEERDVLLPSGSKDTGMMMAFVMPISRELDTIPKPLDSNIELQSLNWELLACYRFSGRVNDSDFQKAEQRLRSWMVSEGLRPIGRPVYAQYNSPSAFPWLRRNEVLIPIKDGKL